MLERRKTKRTRTVLPVKVTIDRSTQMAYAVDISSTGARIGGLRSELKIGADLELQRGSRKANFCVKWIRELGPGELQFGIEAAEPLDSFWGINLSDVDRESKKQVDALMTLLSAK